MGKNVFAMDSLKKRCNLVLAAGSWEEVCTGKILEPIGISCKPYRMAQPIVGWVGGEQVKFSSMAYVCNLKRLVLCEGKLCIICALYITVIQPKHVDHGSVKPSPKC